MPANEPCKWQLLLIKELGGKGFGKKSPVHTPIAMQLGTPHLREQYTLGNSVAIESKSQTL
jgi:hypothetical protein